MNDTETFGFVMDVLLLFDKYDLQGELFWRVGGKYAPISFFVNCNDLFWWGTADSEPLTEGSLPVLKKALADVEVLGEVSSYGLELYCCRQRGMRPQGAWYKLNPDVLWPLFDACGPDRQKYTEMFGNPFLQPLPREVGGR